MDAITLRSRSSTSSDPRFPLTSPLDGFKQTTIRKVRGASSPTLPFDAFQHAEAILQPAYASDEEAASPSEGDDLSSAASQGWPSPGREQAAEVDDDDNDDYYDALDEADFSLDTAEAVIESYARIEESCRMAEAVRFVRAGRAKVVVLSKSSSRRASIEQVETPIYTEPSTPLEVSTSDLSKGQHTHVRHDSHQTADLESPTKPSAGRRSLTTTDGTAYPAHRPNLRLETLADFLESADPEDISATPEMPQCTSPVRTASPRKPGLVSPFRLKALGRMRRTGSKLARKAAQSPFSADVAARMDNAPAASIVRPRAPSASKLIARGACERAPAFILPPSPADDDTASISESIASALEEIQPGFLKRKLTASSVAVDSLSGKPLVYQPDRRRMAPLGVDAPSVVYAHS